MAVNGPGREYFLKTERLGFSYWSAQDLPLALGLWGNAQTAKLIGGPFTDAQVEQRLQSEIALMNDHQVQHWPIFILENHEHAGCAGLRPYRREQRIYELGFHLRPEFWGRGLAQEAGRAVIKFAFEQLGASALFAGHHPENSTSSQVLKKLGFQFTHEEFYPPTGLMHPSYLLTRTNPSTT